MSKNSNYNSTNRSKHYLKCHLIFVCKYRKKLLVGQLKDNRIYTIKRGVDGWFYSGSVQHFSDENVNAPRVSCYKSASQA